MAAAANIPDPRPPAGKNNIWYVDRDTDSVIVFVHGVLSDSRSCWHCPQARGTSGTYWPELLAQDTEFKKYSLYLGGYYTAIDSGPYEIADCAEEIFRSIKHSQGTNRPVLGRNTIIFVAHSLGGVVVRYMLESRSDAFKDKTVGLVLIASPAHGAKIATRLKLLSRMFKNRLGKQLQWGNWSLQDLDRRFWWLLKEERIPKLRGIEACENHFVWHYKWWPFPFREVVSEESCGGWFGHVIRLPDTDHFSCVKPNGRDHPVYRLLQYFCKDFEAEGPSTNPVQSRVKSTFTGRYSCQELIWDLKINEEGDVLDEMSYRGITLNPGVRSIDLPDAETQAGHVSPYELAREDDRTSPGVTVEVREIDATKMKATVRFSTSVEDNQRPNFCLRNRFYNVYSMNMEEYRLKPSWRSDGIDFLEKLIDEDFEVFSAIVQFPMQLKFAKLPTFEIYRIEGNNEVIDDDLTKAFRNCFSYAQLNQTATLRVHHPPATYYYRISWGLAESLMPSVLTPSERERQQEFSRRLLDLTRVTLSRNKTRQWQSEEAVFAVLASFVEFIKDVLDEKMKVDSGLDPDKLELSLMVLDASGSPTPVLRFAVANHPEYMGKTLHVGDGIAGRAWKRRVLRIGDTRSADPLNRSYYPLHGTPLHTFLFSIPLIDPTSESLIYGILNFGALSEAEGNLLRQLNDENSIRRISEAANIYVLTRILEILKM